METIEYNNLQGGFRILYDDDAICLIFEPKDAPIRRKTWKIKTDPKETRRTAVELAIEHAERQYFKLTHLAMMFECLADQRRSDAFAWTMTEPGVLGWGLEDVSLKITETKDGYEAISFDDISQLTWPETSKSLTTAKKNLYWKTNVALTQRSVFWNLARSKLKEVRSEPHRNTAERRS